MPDVRIDTRIYGAEELTPRPELSASAPAMQPYQAPEAVPAIKAVQGTSILAEGEANLRAANRTEATVLESIGASMSQWLPMQAYEYATTPHYDHEDGFNSAIAMKSVQFPLDEAAEKFLLHTSSSLEFQHKLQRIQEQRQAYEAMGDHGLASFLTGAIDPGYIGIDIASLGASRMARLVGAGNKLAKGVAGVTAAVGAYAGGKLEQQIAPISETEVILNALANGAATGFFHSNGKVTPKDEHFPEQPLNKVVQDMHVAQEEAQATAKLRGEEREVMTPTAKVEAVVPEEKVVPTHAVGTTDARLDPEFKYKTTSGRTMLEGLSSHADPMIATMARRMAELLGDDFEVRTAAKKDLKQGRAYYDPAAHAVYLDRAAPDSVKLHEVAHALTAHKLEFGIANPTTLHGKLAADIEQLRKDVLAAFKREGGKDKTIAYLLQNSHEFVAGLFSQHYPFNGLLSRTKVGTSVSALSKFVDTVRKLLGMRKGETNALVRALGLTEQLAQEPLNVVYHNLAAGKPKVKPIRGYHGTQASESAVPTATHLNVTADLGPHFTTSKATAKMFAEDEGRAGRVLEADLAFKKVLDIEDQAGWAPYFVAQHLEDVGVAPKGLAKEVSAESDRAAKAVWAEHPHAEGAEAVRVGDMALEESTRAANAYLKNWLVNQGYDALRYLNKYEGDPVPTYIALDMRGVSDVKAHPAPGEVHLSHPDTITTNMEAKREIAKSLAKNIEWSLHKTLASYGAVAKRIADLLVDDPLEMSGNSVVNQHRAIRADLAAFQYKYEDALKEVLASKGYGLKNRILKPREAVKVQQQIERDVGLEMLRRNRASIDGAPILHDGIPEHITKLADHLDAVSKEALEELKRSGVSGAEDIAQQSGYFSRRWDITKVEALERKLTEGGLTPKEAQGRIRDLLAVGIQRANGWDAELSSDVAKAILDRTRSKGYFEDSAFRAHTGNDALAEVRNLLTGSGLPEARMQRVLDVLAGKVDEAGKSPMLKHRIDMAMDERIRLPDGSYSTIADLVDMNMAATTERYLDGVSTQAALARKGLTKASDVAALRKELLESIADIGKREKAAYLFDQTMNALRGLPTGEELPDFMRKSQAVTQMVGLAASGTWQVTEYATAMMQYGALRTFGNMIREFPGLRAVFSHPEEATHLRNILARNASEDIRIRPFVQRLEDGFEVPVSDAMQLSMMQAKQMVPYINAMKYVQKHQAKTVANLIVDTFDRAARGDAKAMDALRKYGLESPTMGKIRADIVQHGMDTAKWSKATWDEVRGPLTKMMDDSVLKNRTGEIPAFAQFSQIGKFIFTFRSFTLGAHNKILAGSLHRDGLSGLGLLMLYQFPLTVAATAVNDTIQGKKQKTDAQLVAESFNQMGSLGLAGELVGVITGTKQQWGSPGSIGWDRMYKLGGAIASGKAGNIAAAGINATPILPLIPGIKAIGENLKAN